MKCTLLLFRFASYSTLYIQYVVVCSVSFRFFPHVHCSLFTEYRERTARCKGGQVPAGLCPIESLSHRECSLFTLHSSSSLSDKASTKLSEHENECNVLDPEPGGGVHPCAQPGHADPPARPLVNIFDNNRTQLVGLCLV